MFLPWYSSGTPGYGGMAEREGELLRESRTSELFCKNPSFSQWNPPTRSGGAIAQYEAVGNGPRAIVGQIARGV